MANLFQTRHQKPIIYLPLKNLTFIKIYFRFAESLKVLKKNFHNFLELELFFLKYFFKNFMKIYEILNSKIKRLFRPQKQWEVQGGNSQNLFVLF